MSLFSGNDAARAATTAASQQEIAGLKAKRGLESGFGTAGEQLTTSFEQAGLSLAPFQQIGQNALGQANLLTDRQAQLDFIANDPQTQQAIADTQRALSAQGAAGGQALSGNTLQALTQASGNIGQNALAQQQANIQQGINTGLNVAGSQANLATGLGQGLSNLTTEEAIRVGDLTTGIGATQAAGTVGAQNARTQAQSGALNAGLSLLGTVFPAAAPLTALAPGAVNNAASANTIGGGKGRIGSGLGG